MPNSSFDVDTSPVDLAIASPEILRQLLDSRSTAHSETQDQIIVAAIRSLREQLEKAPHHAGQDASHITSSVDQLHGLLQRLTVLRSPVTHLPPEILAHIFELYISNGIEKTPAYVSVHSPFRLVQVCKRWRAIAESDPRLWTSIHFHFPESHLDRTDDVPRIQPVFDLHLKRSGALPISLTFTDHRIYQSATVDLVSLLVDRLRTHARRWKRISLQLSSSYFPLLFTFTPCDLSSLEHLSLNGDVLPQRTVTTPRLSLESATNLKSFTYNGPGRSVDEQIDLHWDGLEEVSFDYIPHGGQSSTLARQFRHLSQCQNITTFSLGINRPFWHVLNGGQAIILPCLQTLRVRRLSPHSNAQSSINPLILPQLQTLEIDASELVHWNTRWHDGTFSALLQRSACPLRHLSIQDVDFPNEELVRCLRLSPTLTSFRFIPCPRSQDISNVIHQLDVSPAETDSQTLRYRGEPVVGGPLLPRLHEITLASSVEGYLGQMIEMFRSRKGTRARAAGVATLRRAEVVFFDMWHETDASMISLPGARAQRVAGAQAALAQLVSEDKEGNGSEDEDMLEASVTVDSPYLPEYTHVIPGGPGQAPGSAQEQLQGSRRSGWRSRRR